MSAFLHTILSGASQFPLLGNTIHKRNFVRQRILNFSSGYIRESTTTKGLELSMCCWRHSSVAEFLSPSMLPGCGVSPLITTTQKNFHIDSGLQRKQRAPGWILVLILGQNHLSCMSVPSQLHSLIKSLRKCLSSVCLKTASGKSNQTYLMAPFSLLISLGRKILVIEAPHIACVIFHAMCQVPWLCLCVAAGLSGLVVCKWSSRCSHGSLVSQDWEWSQDPVSTWEALFWGTLYKCYIMKSNTGFIWTNRFYCLKRSLKSGNDGWVLLQVSRMFA